MSLFLKNEKINLYRACFSQEIGGSSPSSVMTYDSSECGAILGDELGSHHYTGLERVCWEIQELMNRKQRYLIVEPDRRETKIETALPTIPEIL